MRYETLHHEAAQGVVWITLARPDSRNALTAQMRSDLFHAVRQAPRQGRALVITGLGDDFCAGQDLGDARRLADADLGRLMREEIAPLLEALEDCPIPTLAAINGPAAGMGAALALACDISVASERASLALPHVRAGMIADAGLSWRLPRLAGAARARGLVMLGEPVSARTAADWGLIWEAVPDDIFPARVQARGEALAEGPTRALVLARQSLREGAAAGFSDHLETEADLQAAAGRTHDFQEGIVALSEGRAPVFEGR